MVNQAKARLLNPLEKEKRFECYNCFKAKKAKGAPSGPKTPEKREFFCSFCKYKFKSAKTTCPYCGKNDRIIERNVTVVELLG